MPQKIGLIALWALNIVLYAVIVVAAIESVANLSPVWPVTVACAVVYAVIVGVLWQKMDLALKWELSAALLAALLAYSGWRTGSLGAPGGLTVIGQSADVAAAALLILILASTAITIAFTKPLPWWLRAAIALILVYAMIPLIDALAHGAGLGAALRTNAPFPSDPYWIRGAFIGVSIVLPLAGLAALILAVTVAIRKHGAAALRLAAGGLALVFAAQMSGLEAVNAGLPALPVFERSAGPFARQTQTSQSSQTSQNTQSSQTSQTTQTVQPSSDQQTMAQLSPVALAMPGSDYQTASNAVLSQPSPAAAPQLDQVAKQLDKIVPSIPADAYDVDQRAKTLPSDVNTIFTFVRDQIRYESYPGVLRGAQGTYAARAGNAADRSFLLAHILKAKNIPVRVATGQLAQADAARLYDRIFAPPSRAAGATPAPLPTSAESQALKDRIYARARRDYAVVRSALGNQLPDAAIMSRDDVIKEIQSHTWVQAQVGGRWEDLDTSFSDATPGKAYCTADKTYETPADDMMQQVTIRVTTETLVNGSITKDTSLELTLPASQLLDQQIYITHSPPGLRGLLGAGDTLSPMVMVAGEAHLGKPIVFGDTTSSQGKLGGAIEALSTNPPGSATSNFVAESLEFEIRFPGGRTDLSRRVLIDRAGAAWRASATHDPAALRTLKRDARGVPLEADAIYNVWFSAGGHDMLSYAQAVQALLHSFGPPDASGAPPQLSFGEQVWPLALRDFAWVVWSDHVAVPSLNDSPNLRFYPDSPRIFVFGFGPDPSGQLGFFSESDLRRDTLRGLARDPSANASLIEHKLWFGVLEGSLEHEVSATDAAGSGGQMALTTTSGLLTPDGVVVIRPGSSPASLSTDKNTASRMAAALANGDVLVVPRPVMQGGPAGWWQIAHNGADTRAVLGEDLNSSYARGAGGGPRMPGQGYKPKPGGGKFGAGKPSACGSEDSCLDVIMAEITALAAWEIGILVAEVIAFVIAGIFVGP